MWQSFKGQFIETLSIKKFNIKLLCLVIVLVLVLSAGACFWFYGRPHTYISIYNWETGELLIQKEIFIGDIITLNYIHSADKTPVEVVFEADLKGLKLIEESYSWYGAGLEAGSGRSFTFEGDKVTVRGYGENYFEELPVRVARTVPQELTISDEVIMLSELAAGGTLLIIKIEQ